MFAKQSERKNMLIYNTTYQVEEGQEDNFRALFVYSVTVKRAVPVIPFSLKWKIPVFCIAGIWNREQS